MTKGEQIEAKLDWCIAALKHLLATEAGVELPEADEDAWLDEEDEPEDMSQFEHTAVRTRRQPKAKTCPHNQQALVNGRVVCVRPNPETGVICGTVLNQSGVRGRDPNSPVPAPGQEDQFNHVSSQNPGSPLVPY